MPLVSEKTVRFSRVCSVDDSVPRLYVLVSSVVLMGLAQLLFSSFQPSPQVHSPWISCSARQDAGGHVHDVRCINCISRISKFSCLRRPSKQVRISADVRRSHADVALAS
jgi:hypothetical protein